MNETWSDLKGKAKHLLAGFLFITFVIGGCGTAFSLFAAAISQLQNVDTRYESTSVSAIPNQEQPNQEQSNQFDGRIQGNQPQPPQQSLEIPSLSLTQSDEQLSRMHSPIGDAIDNGGVYVGTRVQEAFGSMLKGVITTLFLEQNDSPQQGGSFNGRVSN